MLPERRSPGVFQCLVNSHRPVIVDVIQLQPADQKSRDGKTQSIPKPDGGIRTCADSDPLFGLDCNRAFCLVFEFHGCGTHIR